MARQTVGCFSEAELQRLAEQPNIVVMKPTHDITFTPLPVLEVDAIVTRLVDVTRTHAEPARAVEGDAELAAFAAKYGTMAKKLCDKDFVADERNIEIIRRMLRMKGRVDSGELDETVARAEVSDLALTDLAKRVAEKHAPDQ